MSKSMLENDNKNLNKKENTNAAEGKDFQRKSNTTSLNKSSTNNKNKDENEKTNKQSSQEHNVSNSESNSSKNSSNNNDTIKEKDLKQSQLDDASLKDKGVQPGIKLLPRTKAKMLKMKDSASKYDEKMEQPVKKDLDAKNNDKEMTEKTQKLIKTLTQNKQKAVEKAELTDQNKNSFQIDSLGSWKKTEDEEFDDEGKDFYTEAEGVVKRYIPYLKPTSKNSEIGIKSSVIGKKQDVKIIANKHIIMASIGLAVLLLISIISNIAIYSIYKFKTQNPPITVTKTLSVNVGDNTTGVASVSLPNNVLPNMWLVQNVSAYALTLKEDMLIRTKAIFTSSFGDEFLLEIQLEDDWVLGDDGYYYYNGVIKTGEVLNAINKVKTPMQLFTKENTFNLHVITFIFETMSVRMNADYMLWNLPF